MGIDVFTLTVLGAVLSLALAAVMLAGVGLGRPGRSGSLTLWTAAMALQGLYWLSFWYVRDAPPLIGVVVPNMTMTLATAVGALAIQRFTASPDRRAWLGGVVLLSLAGNLWFGVAEPSYAGRVAVVATSLALLMATAATPLLGSFRRPGEAAERITASVLVLGALLMLGRVVELPFVAAAQDGPLQQRPMQVLTLLYVSLMPAFTTIGFLLMHARRANDEVLRLAGSDPLTDTLNRRAAHAFGARALAASRRHQRPLSVLLVDIDHFRSINENHGPRGGDALLQTVASRIRDVLRSGDGLGRIGGEEFLAILPDTGVDEAAALAERIREGVVARHCEFAGEEIAATVSIGVAGRDPGEADIEGLLQRADAAMYAAKRGGRNRVSTAPRGGAGRVATG